MRVCFVVLASVSALIAGGAPAFATASEKAEVLSSVNTNKFEGTTQRFLRSHDKDSAVEEERGIDADKLLKIINADDIALALTNYEKRVELFQKWWQYEDDVVAKLMEMPNRIKNLPILTKFNNFRTSMHYNQVLTPWLSTKDLDDVGTALAAYNMKPMKEQFAKWYKSGVTSPEFSAAIAKVENSVKRKRYGALDSHYKMFVQGEANKTARAAAKKVEEFAAKKAQAKKIADAAAKAAAKRTAELQAKKAAAKKIADAAAKRAAEFKAKRSATAA
ncbi:hypothetical protein V7S43_007198 [Phytophthora oleae]|uniref:RxLR effector protein n=1 Tax=Phytophthora oleae TaxID=2107226 RepID=A0ABD3FPV0_9STRA